MRLGVGVHQYHDWVGVMPTREQNRDAWRIVQALATTECLTVYDPAQGSQVCRFCGGEAPWDARTGGHVPIHRLDCLYLAAIHLRDRAALGRSQPLMIPPDAFDPLLEFLSMQDSDPVTIPLAEIETMIGYTLPDSAYVSVSYWSSSSTAKIRWEATGWRGALRAKTRSVVFRRVPVLPAKSDANGR